MQFEQTHALVQQKQAEQAVSLAFINALKSPESFLAFLGVSDLESLRQSQLKAGQFITDLLYVAQLRPAGFRSLFETLFRQHLQGLSAGFKTAPPVELWARLFLCSFLAQLSGLKDATTNAENLDVQICEHYFQFYEGQLPEAYAYVLGEFGVFPLLGHRKLEQAWNLERQSDYLSRLLERDGPGLLDLVALLFNLHAKFGADEKKLAQTRELLDLRFGEAEVAAALARSEF